MERHEICLLLDKLTIDMLHLLEDRVKCQMIIENANNNGNMQLAKARYIMGHNSVSKVQLPTEGSAEFSASSALERTTSEEELGQTKYILDQRKSEQGNDFVNPLKWFGVLVPQNLIHAQKMFSNILQHIVECVNIQKQLESTSAAIERLKQIKSNLNPEE